MLRWLKTVVVSDVEKASEEASGRDQEDERKRIADDVSLVIFKWHQNRGGELHRGISLAGVRLLARWCPAWRRREPDLRLRHGTWEGAPRHCPLGEWREGVSQAG
jgi:hypothetical protein